MAEAYAWLCAQRRHHPANADVWGFRFHAASGLPLIASALARGSYRFSPMQVVSRTDHTEVPLWSAADALVQKALALTLADVLPMHRLCTHVKGHGGHKYSVRKVQDYVQGGHYPWVCKTDIKGFYAISTSIVCSINSTIP
ncbi:MAG: hypothetical protein H7842_12235 [Gammaproteobacteria bacterium SHHR-1]